MIRLFIASLWLVLLALLASIAIPLMFGLGCAHAQNWTVGVHTISVHASAGYETVTPGLYARSPDGWTAGVLRNSERRLSVYGGRTWERQGWAVTAGLITGYRRADVLPLVIPSYRFDNGLRAALVLNPSEPRGSAIHLSWEW